MSHTPRQPAEPPDQDARLAELLDACLNAERGATGSASEIVRAAPEELRNDLDELMSVARALTLAEWIAPTAEFRADARARFDAAAQPPRRETIRPRLTRWLVGLAAGLALSALTAYGSVLASAGSLPGDPLYAVKQADEAITLGLSRDDLSRTLVLLQQAGVRLEEVRRLIQAGRLDAAGDLLRDYATTLERAGTMLKRVTAVDPRARAEFQTHLQRQLGQLQTLASEAPPPLQSSIQRAQAAASQALQQDENGGQGGGGGPALGPSPVSPAVSPSPASSPAVRSPAPAQPSASPVRTPAGEDAPGK